MPLALAEARLAALDVFGAHTAAKGRAVRAWCELEVTSEQPSSCGCFNWQIEKCHTERTAPTWDADSEFRAADFDIPLPAGLQRPTGKPFQVLVQAALATAGGAAEFEREMQTESQQVLSDLFVCLYKNVQSHLLRVDEFCKLIDLIGTRRRREIQLGSILRSINSRSCPAAMEKRSFQEIGEEAYCQTCHRTGVENGVSRCGGCGVVAYCSKRHAQDDSKRHGNWCAELLFSRVLQSALPWPTYTETSRRLIQPYTPTALACLQPGAPALPATLPSGWRPFFDLHQQPPAAPAGGEATEDGGKGKAKGGPKAAGQGGVFDDVLATDALSSVMSVAYALSKLGLGTDSKLCLHLMGVRPHAILFAAACVQSTHASDR